MPCGAGAVVGGGRSFLATRAGYRDPLTWASSFGVVGRAGVEGTGSYGASLCRYLMTQDVRVIEVDRPGRVFCGVNPRAGTGASP